MATSSSSKSHQPNQPKISTYYNILEIDDHPDNVDQVSIKNAYRRLAFLHHPDRNSSDKKCAEKFRLIGEAYQVLSHLESKNEYDRQLRRYKIVPEENTSKTDRGNSNVGNRSDNGKSNSKSRSSGIHKFQNFSPFYSSIRDPYEQFIEVFRNDPILNEAFEEQDDTFAQKSLNTKNCSFSNQSFHDGWLVWFLQLLGADIQTTTVTNYGDGNVVESQFVTSGTTLRTEKSERKSRTFVDEKTGWQVRIQSIERDGKRLDEKYINSELVAQRINGKVHHNLVTSQ